MFDETLTGIVRAYGGSGYFRVDCPEAPAHLRVLYLQPWAMRSAGVGDRVELAYRATGRGYEWVVTERKVQ